MIRFTFVALVLAACGGDDGGGVQTDAAVTADASSKVMALASCPATVAATMTTGDSAFIPMAAVTVNVGDVVKLESKIGHPIGPNPLQASDPALKVPQNMTKCFKFNATGTYGIMCEIHSFAGTITVN